MRLRSNGLLVTCPSRWTHTGTAVPAAVWGRTSTMPWRSAPPGTGQTARAGTFTGAWSP